MIIWSPPLLDELGGLRDSAPVTISDDPTTKELAKDTGFVKKSSQAQAMTPAPHMQTFAILA